jgi:hypothetical protein
MNVDHDCENTETRPVVAPFFDLIRFMEKEKAEGHRDFLSPY